MYKQSKNAGTKVEGNTVKIVIPIRPYTKKNHQQIVWKNGKDGKKIPYVKPSVQFLQYQKDCGFFIRPLNISSPVNVKALFFIDRLGTVDLTNLNEALHDILVYYGFLTDDNCKIIVSCDGSRVLYDKEYPRTEVTITPVDATFIKPQK